MNRIVREQGPEHTWHSGLQMTPADWRAVVQQWEIVTMEDFISSTCLFMPETSFTATSLDSGKDAMPSWSVCLHAGGLTKDCAGFSSHMSLLEIARTRP